ncbi:LapA family protein [Enterococcus olivae]
MKNQWRIILGLVLTLLIVIFAVMNTMTVNINFGFSEISAPLIVVVIGSAFIGAIIIVLVTTGTIWQQRREIKHLQKQKEELDNEIDKRVADKKEELEREYNNKTAELEAVHTVYPAETQPEQAADWQE